MTDRETLIDDLRFLAQNCNREEYNEINVGYAMLKSAELLEKAIIPPCKVGDTVYEISSGELLNCTVQKIEILLTERISMYIDISIEYSTYSCTETIEPDYFGETVFLTREEAEKALAERQTP